MKKRVLLESDASGVNKRKLIQKVRPPESCGELWFSRQQSGVGSETLREAVVEELVRLVSTDKKPYKLEQLGLTSADWWQYLSYLFFGNLEQSTLGIAQEGQSEHHHVRGLAGQWQDHHLHQVRPLLQPERPGSALKCLP